jgi:hypothetical protein
MCFNISIAKTKVQIEKKFNETIKQWNIKIIYQISQFKVIQFFIHILIQIILQYQK